MSLLKPTKEDYRALIAVICTLLYFGLVIVMLWQGRSVSDIAIVAALFGTPWGMIIAWYFNIKQEA
jgi:hypothetical protein